MLRNVFTKTLWDQRRSLLRWAVGLAAVIAVYVAPYRQYLNSGALNVNTDSALYRAIGYDGSPAGYLTGTLFALTGPLLVIMAAAMAGARAIAGDEEAGTLELLLAHPGQPNPAGAAAVRRRSGHHLLARAGRVGRRGGRGRRGRPAHRRRAGGGHHARAGPAGAGLRCGVGTRR